jgi:hypothetical protein
MRERAEQRVQEALAGSGARDPRDHYRTLLRELRQADPGAYARAVDYYENTLLPAVADESSAPLAEWLAYGQFLTSLFTRGRTVQIDASGLAREFDRESAAGTLVLHIPASVRDAVRVVGLPQQLSPAQRATYELLVRRPEE